MPRLTDNEGPDQAVHPEGGQRRMCSLIRAIVVRIFPDGKSSFGDAHDNHQTKPVTSSMRPYPFIVAMLAFYNMLLFSEAF